MLCYGLMSLWIFTFQQLLVITYILEDSNITLSKSDIRWPLREYGLLALSNVF